MSTVELSVLGDSSTYNWHDELTMTGLRICRGIVEPEKWRVTSELVHSQRYRTMFGYAALTMQSYR